jgi:GH25 family lysozyme M1 (1,4-beta-N-acetylmuramidase)
VQAPEQQVSGDEPPEPMPMPTPTPTAAHSTAQSTSQAAPPPAPSLPATPAPPRSTHSASQSTTQALQGEREVQGVDVSHYQGTINWNAAHGAGIDVAYAKATEGTSYVDPSYARNHTAAPAAGVAIGAYHFARPGHDGGSVEADARAEAQHFLSAAKPATGDLVPALDLEATGGLGRAELGRWTKTWLDTVSAGIDGRKPLVYVSPSFWSAHVDDVQHVADEYPLWVANWGVDAPTVPGTWDAWRGWQKTSDGAVAGIDGRVDRDTFRAPAALALQS